MDRERDAARERRMYQSWSNNYTVSNKWNLPQENTRVKREPATTQCSHEEDDCTGRITGGDGLEAETSENAGRTKGGGRRVSHTADTTAVTSSLLCRED